jgi:hypothetical protein
MKSKRGSHPKVMSEPTGSPRKPRSSSRPGKGGRKIPTTGTGVDMHGLGRKTPGALA